MDKKFLEFWGTMMLSAAKGQQQLDDIMRWYSENFSEYKDFTELLCKMYGIDTEAQKSSGHLNVWRKAFEDFQKNFSELAVMMDLVPRKDYIELSRENQELKKRIAELEEGNARFRALLDEKVTPAAGLKGFQDLISEQARQYQDFMKSIGDVFAEKPDKPGAQASFKTKPAEAPAAKAKPKPAQAGKKPAHHGAKTGK